MKPDLKTTDESPEGEKCSSDLNCLRNTAASVTLAVQSYFIIYHYNKERMSHGK